MRCQRGWTPQGVLPAAAGHLLLLQVLRTALQQPGQLLQEGGALGSQRLASADPTLEGGLGWEGAAFVLTVALEVGLNGLDAIH